MKGVFSVLVISLFFSAVVGSAVFCAQGSVNVGVTVPVADDEWGGGEAGEDNGEDEDDGGDVIAPVISNIQELVGETGAMITWDTNENADSQTQYGLTNAYGSVISKVDLIMNHSISLANLLPNTVYHYRLVSTDVALNSASSFDRVFTTLKDNVPPPDVDNLQINAGQNSISLIWDNPTLINVPDFAGVKITRKIGSHSNTVNDGLKVYDGALENFTDNNVLPNVEYFYTVFSYDTSGNYSAGTFVSGKIVPIIPPLPFPGQENCNNGVDDNANGFVDCADLSCINLDSCKGDPLIILPPPLPGEIHPPAVNIQSFAKIGITDMLFLAGNRQIRLIPNDSAVITSLAGSSFTVAVPANVLTGIVSDIFMQTAGGSVHQFSFGQGSNTYFSDIIYPRFGIHKAFLEVRYDDGRVDVVEFSLNSLAMGEVVNEGAGLAGVEITLLNQGGQLVDLAKYGENNPFVTDKDAVYGWVVPNGQYFLGVISGGYVERKVPINVNNNVININLSLFKILKLDEKEAVVLLINASKIGLQKFSDNVKNPIVVDTASRIVVPTVVGVAVIGAASILSWSSLFNLLQLLFLQPLLLLGKRKRDSWGLVYNSLNKLPVDLAVVRLVDARSGKIVQSRVTDVLGKYIFNVKPGKYKIQITKDNFVFPSILLKDFKNDGSKTDIYHGETINVSEEDAVITANVPLDPVGAKEAPIRLKIEKMLRGLQVSLSWVGLAVTAVTFYYSRLWYIGVLLMVHVLVFLIFRRLAIPKKPKGWGIVYDSQTKKPITRVVARLFDAQFNKLVATQITDNNGRYYFLAGDNKYYMTYTHEKYAEYKTDEVDMNGRKNNLIALNIALKKS